MAPSHLDAVNSYLKALEKALGAGRTTEHSHRPALKAFLEAIQPKVMAINEPGKVECGAPDFLIVTSSPSIIVGYVEAKDIGLSLEDAERSEQLKRYRRSLSNILLTDYIDFRWYIDGEFRSDARVARLRKPSKKEAGLERIKGGDEAVTSLLRDFLSHAPVPISSPKELAERLARITHLIRDIIVETFQKGRASPLLADLRKAFATVLIPELDRPAKTSEFADMYAQSIAYGLFAARCNHRGPQPFRRVGAAADIPKTNPFLRRLFETMTGADLEGEPYAGLVDDLVQLLDHTHIAVVLSQFGKRTRREDPVVHFYETFLSTYDPTVREMRGVYYTPAPVVSYIVRSVDALLQERFSLSDGLADNASIEYLKTADGNGKKKRTTKALAPRVLLLDPACGTGTFLYGVVDLIRDRFMQRGEAGIWSGYVRKHLLPRLLGFELLMAPYAVAHFKLGMQLAGHDLTSTDRKVWAYDFSGHERLGIYLTNTLEAPEARIETLFGPMRVISDEASAAARIKRELPILVVMGNPPYSGHSANRSWEVRGGKKIHTFIGQLLQDYYEVDGKPLGERNPKWLQDDYVKFVRWGQWRIEQTGAGILALITNHGYLENPTFRGMRQRLMQCFSEIYILDLHGSSKKRERAPGGAKDENVFDIQQGVAISLFVKQDDARGPARVWHADLYGPRREKYAELDGTHVGSTKWTRLEPQGPSYLFLPRNEKIVAEYERGWKITDVFPVNSVGIVTARDELTLAHGDDELWDRVQTFASLPAEKAREVYILGEDTRDWKVQLAQQDLRASGPDRANIVPITYRPFDVRFTYYTGQSRGFLCMPRPDVMRHMRAGPNVGLVSARSNKSSRMDHFFVSRHITEAKCGEATTQSALFPLYLYLKGTAVSAQSELVGTGPWQASAKGRAPNLAEAFVRYAEKRLELKFVPEGTGDLKHTFGPEDVLHYVYAVFHSPTYRDRYGDLLRLDFPRVPLGGKELFGRLCEHGATLTSLHLLDISKAKESEFSYPVPGDHRVEKSYPKYVTPGAVVLSGKKLSYGRVYINEGQYFDGVTPEVWGFQIGGYRVCERWLRDRRGRALSFEDLSWFRRTLYAVRASMVLMTQIDETIATWPIA